MSDLFHVTFIAYGVPQSVRFENECRARSFADDVHGLGYGGVEVYDEFDPRDTTGPVYAPGDDDE